MSILSTLTSDQRHKLEEWIEDNDAWGEEEEWAQKLFGKRQGHKVQITGLEEVICRQRKQFFKGKVLPTLKHQVTKHDRLTYIANGKKVPMIRYNERTKEALSVRAIWMTCKCDQYYVTDAHVTLLQNSDDVQDILTAHYEAIRTAKANIDNPLYHARMVQQHAQ